MQRAVVTLILIALQLCYATSIKPNVVIVVADDLGYTDCGFHGGDQIPTPHIDYLAHNGIIFDNYYTPKICTPSRAALLTGRHPMQLGLQRSVIFASHPWGLGLNETVFPQYLKKYGYATHAIGKWHLGNYHLDYTPTKRGFDSHFGHWAGKTDYFTHENTDAGATGIDFWENTTVATQYNGSYGTELFGDRAVDLIMQHNQSNPFFLYLAHQAVHNGIQPQPLKAPQEYLDKFKFIKHDGRRRYAAMLSVLDDSIGNLTAALKRSGMYNNTIIVFTTDNGGPAAGFSSNYASNWPLRGCKATNWEGGVRAAAFLHSPMLKAPRRTLHNLMYVADWLPTIMSAIGEKLPPKIKYYGVDQWDVIQRDSPHPRQEIIHNYDQGVGAVKIQNWKLLVGFTNAMNGWYPEEEENYLPTKQTPYIKCGERNSTLLPCQGTDKYCLFDLSTDPCEYNNLAHLYPMVCETMYETLMRFNDQAQPPRVKPSDNSSLPIYHSGHWTNWCDKHPINQTYN